MYVLLVYRSLTPIMNIVYGLRFTSRKKNNRKRIGSCLAPSIRRETLVQKSWVAQERYAKTPVHQLKSHL